jgi:hypothetical protein
MSTHKQWMAAVVIVLMTAGVMLTMVAAQVPPPPPGSQESKPIQVPSKNAEDVEISAEEDPFWKHIFIHNNTGVDGDPETGEGYDPGNVARRLRFLVKRPRNHTREEHRIVVNRVRKRDSEGNWKDITDGVTPSAGGNDVTVQMDEGQKHCEVVEVRFKVEVRKKSSGSWGSWGSDESARPKFNIHMQDAFGVQFVQAGTGDSPFGTGMLATVSDAFDNLSPVANFAITQLAPGESGVFAAPDLVFSEASGWTMPEGTLRFFATGGVPFDSGSSLQAIARDEEGNDAVLGGDVTLGTPTVNGGVIEVPVQYRNPESEHRIAIMVRGAEVDVPEMGSGTEIGYTVGGVAAGADVIRIAPLVRIGTLPEGHVFKSSADLVIVDPQDPEDFWLVGGVGELIFVARTDQAGAHQGFIDAIVIGESETGVIRAGSFEITPLDGKPFVATEDTKLFALYADNTEAVDAFDDATIEVTAAGALRVTLGARQANGALKLMILNPKIDMGAAPFYDGENARFAVGGDALRGHFQRSILLVEGSQVTTYRHESLLPDEPLQAHALTPLAEVDE